MVGQTLAVNTVPSSTNASKFNMKDTAKYKV